MGATIKQLLQESANLLDAKKKDVPHLESAILLGFVLDKPKSYLLAYPEKLVNEDQIKKFWDLIERRIQGVPIAYLIGKKEFWSLELLVNEKTLIPRPETELLVETVLALFPNNQNFKLLDLGTGSGAISLAIANERPNCEILATDYDEAVLAIARENAQRLQIKNISFQVSNWFNTLPHSHFDIIVSNPPYIAENEWKLFEEGLIYEPKSALVSGLEGLDAIQVIVKGAKTFLNSNGYLLIEHGFQQSLKVIELMKEAGFSSVKTLRDISGKERLTFGKKV